MSNNVVKLYVNDEWVGDYEKEIFIFTPKVGNFITINNITLNNGKKLTDVGELLITKIVHNVDADDVNIRSCSIYTRYCL